MTIQIAIDYDEMSRAAADLVIEQVQNKPNSLICFPSGESPAGMLKYLVNDVREGKVDFSQCYFSALDEWVGLGPDDDGSCSKFLHEHFFDHIKTQPGRAMFFDAKAADLDASCRAMDDFIKLHGPLDILIVGIGMNGHIGLNEPGTDFNLYSHHAALDPLTISVGQKYFKQQTELTEGITLGLKYLQEAKIPVLIASGKKKAEIVEKALKDEISERLPATIFQRLHSAIIFLDEDAALHLVD